ncbi:MAG TPA: T9SS type A sorting domain-containing protein [Cyclobacteriaceae bacterium]|nr:T9SS type A sorting domain-containing protein [Cyclobacteriaceae bacterium]
MRILLLALIFLLSTQIVSAQLSPSITIKPKVWLRADAGTITPVFWTDVSGNKRNATALANEGPTQTALMNFNNAIVFDGNDYMKIPYSLERTSELTILSVFHSSDTTERGLWGLEQAVTRSTLFTTRRAIGPDTLAADYGKHEKRAVLNTLSQNWDKTVLLDSTAFLAFGSAGKSTKYKPFSGQVAELIIFDRALTFLERVQYETYLGIKYGTSLKDQNYVSLDNKVLWRASENKSYANHIAGIGREDAFQLYQKQSQSAYDSGFLTVSIGRITASNKDNSSAFANGNFLVWGDNNLSKVDKPGEGIDSVLSIVQRKWMMVATGNEVQKLETEMYVDLKKLRTSADGYWMVIDRSGQGNFSVDNVEYIFPDRYTADGKAVYKVLWDTDKSGKDCFGLARARNLFVVVRTLSDPSCKNETAGKVRIEVVAGKPTYQFTLATSTKVLKEWNGKGSPVEHEGLREGKYVLTVKSNDDQLVRNFSLTMPDALHIDAGQDQRLLPDKEIVLDVKGQVPDNIPVTYLWENNFGLSSEGSKVTVTESGIYKISVTKLSDGCVFSDEVTITGTEEQKLAVYPTIVNRGEQYNVSVSLPEQASVTVQVYDMKGNLIQEWIGSNRTEYSFKGVLNSSGMFVVRLTTPKGPTSTKLVVN